MIERKNSDFTFPELDLYICGFPCQPFSTAGKQKGFLDPRGCIFSKCISFIKEKKPKFFILENVKGILRKGIWDSILPELKNTGYNISYKVLNTKDYGIPQNRERLYIVGCRDSIFSFSSFSLLNCSFHSYFYLSCSSFRFMQSR